MHKDISVNAHHRVVYQKPMKKGPKSKRLMDIKTRRNDKSQGIHRSQARQTGRLPPESHTVMNKARWCSQTQGGRQASEDQSYRASCHSRQRGQVSPQANSGQPCEGQAQALATEPAWDSARAFIARGEGGTRSSLEPRWKRAACQAAAVPLSASCLRLFSRGSPCLNSLCSRPFTNRCSNSSSLRCP